MKLDNSYTALKNYAVNILNIRLYEDACDHNGWTIWNFLKKQVIYVVSKKEEKYEVDRFLVAHLYEDVYTLWKEDGEYDLDRSDLIFDDPVEAEAQCDHLNNPAKFFPVKAGEHKKIWNIILQGWDKYGKENFYSIDSFTTEEAAIAKYYEWMGWDKKAGYEIEEELGCFDYTFTKPNGEMTRCHIVNSQLWNE